MKFIVFGEDWQSHPSSTQHLFKQLAKQHQVIWINSIGMRKPTFRLIDVKRVFNKLKSLFLSKRNRPNAKTTNTSQNINLTAHTLAVLPWHDNVIVRLFNKWVFNRKGFIDDEPIVYWLSVPTAISLISPREQDKVIYYCGDDFSALAGVDHKMVAPFESDLIEKADTIYVVSEFLANKMPKSKVKMLSHGVDLELFTTQTTKAVELEQICKPIIGFYGSLNAWLDKALLLKLAKERPEYQLVLIGHLVEDFSDLLKLDNVTHIPAVEHDRLASFSQHWQVSILPFVDNEQIRACDPLKLKEYIATGTPIVTTRFAAVNSYQETILIADNHQGFIERLDYAVSLSKSNNLNWRANQSQQASDHSWQAKAKLVCKQLRFC
ncbi:glycosyltransferase [Pseudoalteromonas shioyasakiensis]|uniref:Glycosyltransferase n=1 Tax=Pseudoalteromonas shioyasakiensis TaxID=1190813 RepID=A0ABT6TVY5_9GAMM|nr:MULTISPECIES: glycosyltransferase [Pseudoalteromonas]MDI4668058.1 glycosyltransferase [Pseudoalteromonas shioyasakiensis]MDI4672712.1 glycosyltransferase [Pseudoalteromonas shioyasakiensis]MDI4684776.1 glycosyltransferase [Pseudoalteromonas shioyasakiensis]MDI4703260.1 glycosyltransferase [Pseudoalteromonas shioyasakiensis]NUJ20113.1 glycosyltransferase [Pseudoalteromonas sp. 0802]